MARELKERDVEILRKLAPELEELICSGSGVNFRSILPPVANHFSMGEEDFGGRLARLSVEELRYLVDLIEDGSESLGCLDYEFAEVFFQLLAARLSPEVADKAREIYEYGPGCGI